MPRIWMEHFLEKNFQYKATTKCCFSLFYVFFPNQTCQVYYQELHQVVWCILLYGQQCLNMSLKSPLPSFSPSEDSSETIIIWSYKRDAAASPKRTLWRLMTVHPTSINLKSLKNVIFQLLFFLGFPRLVLCIRIAYSQLILEMATTE